MKGDESAKLIELSCKTDGYKISGSDFRSILYLLIGIDGVDGENFDKLAGEVANKVSLNFLPF